MSKTCATPGCKTATAPGHRHCGWHATQDALAAIQSTRTAA